ncbi:MAG: asparagine synthase (glutamine-hydrolyzing) [Planctomycetes bacterium]|nr:asparagine synthase (glutamine-hydrolyzing) [Planctomycetota bacterium]
MCGIAGVVNYAKFNLQKVVDHLRHRGPDDQRIYYHRNIALIHTRLAIQDIAGGGQPMHYGPYTIIFNGEIYNHKELRQQLDVGYLTNSDTETLLHLFARYREKCLDMLDGMFAFAVLNREDHTIFLARDRAGKKPLYIYQDDDHVMFASELNAIRAIISPEIDQKSICQFMRLMEFFRGRTPYKNVTEVEPGSWVRIDAAENKIERGTWWRIFDFYSNPAEVSEEKALEEVDRRLRQSVQRRLESSDLEVGIFLSGGIDSSLITAIAAEYQDRLKTFTVSFAGSYNEAPLAQLTADKFGTDHTEIAINYDSLNDDLETILGNYGEPFADSSAVPSYYVSQAAKKHLTVILNGDGADELFGGYRRYVPFGRTDFFKLPRAIRLLARGMAKVAPLPHEKMSVYNYGYRLADLAGRSGYAGYLSAARDVFEGYQEYIEADDDYMDEIEDIFETINNTSFSGLRKIMNLDFDTFLPDDLLVKMDIATMAHSLEGRSPFLGKDLLEYAPTLPDGYKVRGQTTKYILRKLAGKYVPAEIADQPKRGFEVPLKQWIEGQLKEMIFDYLGGDSFSSRLVRPKFISKLLEKQVRISDEKRARILWLLLSLEIWFNKTRQVGA